MVADKPFKGKKENKIRKKNILSQKVKVRRFICDGGTSLALKLFGARGLQAGLSGGGVKSFHPTRSGILCRWNKPGGG